jgi:hypothetical protein
VRKERVEKNEVAGARDKSVGTRMRQEQSGESQEARMRGEERGHRSLKRQVRWDKSEEAGAKKK